MPSLPSSTSALRVSFWLDASRAPLMAGGAAAGALSAALFLQHVMGVQPCVLCVWQRWPYAVVLALAVAAGTLGPRAPRTVWLCLALMALAGATNTGIAVFHSGVERHWWAGTPGCGVPDAAASLEDFRAALLERPVVRCDEIPWTLLGLSPANYNVFLSSALALFAGLAVWRGRRAAMTRQQ